MQWLNSQAWLGAIQSAMWDFTIFTGPEGDTAVAATIAEQFQELRPGFFRPFGDGGGQRPTVSVVEQLPGNGCFDQRSPPPPPDPEGWRNPYWPGGRMRGKVYVEPPVGGHVCAHLVVVNLQLDAATVFAATLSGGSLTPSSFANLTATRMFVTGPTLSFSNGGTVTDWIGPGATNVYRVGNCTPPAVAGNLASPPVSASYTGEPFRVALPGVYSIRAVSLMCCILTDGALDGYSHSRFCSAMHSVRYRGPSCRRLECPAVHFHCR
jgi:hypothetical protein